MQRSLLSHYATPDEARAILVEAAPFCEYGPDYDRNIADAAADVLQGVEQTWRSDEFRGTFVHVLRVRLDVKKGQ